MLEKQEVRFAVAPMMDWTERSCITRSCRVPCANFAHARSAFLSCSFLRGASIPPAGLRQSARAHSTTVEFAPACPQWRLLECRGDLHALGMPPVARRVWGDLERRFRHTATKVAQFKILKSTSSGRRKRSVADLFNEIGASLLFDLPRWWYRCIAPYLAAKGASEPDQPSASLLMAKCFNQTLAA